MGVMPIPRGMPKIEIRDYIRVKDRKKPDDTTKPATPTNEEPVTHYTAGDDEPAETLSDIIGDDADDEIPF
jgi:hypothetical protein